MCVLTCLWHAIMKRAHLWKLDPVKEGRSFGAVKVGRREGGKKNTLSFHCVPSNSFLVIIEIDVCCGAVNLQDLLLIKRQRQPSR